MDYPLADGAKGRFELIGIYIAGAIGGALVALAIVLVLFLIAALLSSVTGFANLQAALLGPDGQAGLLMIEAWVIWCGVAMILNMVFFTREVGDVILFTVLGGVAGFAVLVVFGMLGLLPVWGQLVPVVGAGVGNLVGIFRTWAGRSPS